LGALDIQGVRLLQAKDMRYFLQLVKLTIVANSTVPIFNAVYSFKKCEQPKIDMEEQIDFQTKIILPLVIFYNRGKQMYSITNTFLSS
jgi:hypothetical protein